MTEKMEALFSQFSIMANEALVDKNFDPSRIEEFFNLFEHEAHSSLSAAEAQHHKEADDAEASMKEAEHYLNSLLDATTSDFNRHYEEIGRSSEKELKGLVSEGDAAEKMGLTLGSGANGASERYLDATLASAMANMKSALAAAKINKVHPS